MATVGSASIDRRRLGPLARALGTAALMGFGLIGVGVFALGLLGAIRAAEPADWPIAEGRIVSSRIVSPPSSPDRTELAVVYEYRVRGQDYRATTLAPGYAASRTEDLHLELLGVLPPGRRVGVRFDPAAPERATLSLGLNAPIRTNLVVGAVWIALAAALLWLARPRPSRSERILRAIRFLEARPGARAAGSVR